MKRSNRAWKFYFPGLDRECLATCGFSITPGGGIEMISETASIRQSLLMLLSISPGERIMNPEYGCNLRKLVFSQNDGTTAGLAIHYVREAIGRWEKRVHIIRLDAFANQWEPQYLEILIEYRPIDSLHTETFTYSINLAQG